MKISSDRCPWCGEKFDRKTKPKFDKTNGIELGRGLGWCRNCGNWYRYKPTAAMFLVFVLLFIGGVMLKAAPTAGIIIIIICIIISLLAVHKLPKEKYPAGGQSSVHDLPSCKVNVDWDKKYFMLNYRVWSGYIFPVCFVDENDTPKSNVWCAKFDVSKRRKNNMSALMCFLREDAPREKLFKENNRFVVFYDKEIIGQGTITAEKI